MADYKEMSDDRLIELSQHGNEYALETILIRYKPLVYKKSQPYYLAGGDDDDVVQEGLIGLYKAVMSFDKTKFPLFKVFAGVCVERRILSAVKKASRLKHNPLNFYVSLSKTDGDTEDDRPIEIRDSGIGQNPENIMIERESVLGLEDKILGTLSPLETKVLLCNLEGRTHKETAEILGRDIKAVDNATQRIKKKIYGVLK